MYISHEYVGTSLVWLGVFLLVVPSTSSSVSCDHFLNPLLFYYWYNLAAPSIHLSMRSWRSNDFFLLNSCPILVKPVCKYLGVYVDNKLSFRSHIEYVKTRLGKQSGIIPKLRHFVPKFELMNYYKTNVVPIIQYGILVFGCCSYKAQEPIFIMQKILKLIYFRKRSDSCDDIFLKNECLTVYELHIYELLKFVLRSIFKIHSIDSLNKFFVFSSQKVTRSSKIQLLQEPLCKLQIERYSIKYRATKLYNILRINQILPDDMMEWTFSKVTKFYHSIKTSYILPNPELVRHIFSF